MKVNNMVKQIPMKHLAFFSLLCSSAASAAERPNIIYIFTDQQTASAMSCAGNPDLHTPNLDRLAAAGIMFNNAYCTAPLSGPSRGAMFTGHYPDAVGLSVNGSPMPDSLRTQTLGTLIKNAGYVVLMAVNGISLFLMSPTKNTASTTYTNIVTTDWRKPAPNTSHANIKSRFF